MLENMLNKKGRKVANQFSNSKCFKSYENIIVKIKDNITYLDKYYWDYSRTTSKYRNIFLNETTKETRAKIKSGKYILTNLNERSRK